MAKNPFQNPLKDLQSPGMKTPYDDGGMALPVQQDPTKPTPAKPIIKTKTTKQAAPVEPVIAPPVKMDVPQATGTKVGGGEGTPAKPVKASPAQERLDAVNKIFNMPQVQWQQLLAKYNII